MNETFNWPQQAPRTRLASFHQSTKRYGTSLVVGKTKHGPPRPKATHVVTAADSLVSRVSLAYQNMLAAVREATPTQELADALAAKDYNAVLRVLDLENRMGLAAKGAGIGVQQTSFQEALKDTFAAGAYAELAHLQTVPIVKAINYGAGRPDSIGVKLGFDLVNPEALHFLSTYTFNLIRQLSQDAIESIRTVLLKAFAQGGSPADQARKIKQVIGLTDTQINAVGNFQQALSGDPEQLRQALQRGLRDRRFDPTLINAINQGGVLDEEQIQRMADRYYERYQTYRAEMIARTETIRASTMGQQEVWRQAVEQELLQTDRTKQIWIVTHDDRLCEYCLEIADQNKDGIPLGEMFASSEGSVSGPPLHPHCRCAVGLRIED